MVKNKRLDELGDICHACKKPKRYPGCQDHCEVGIEYKAINEAERKARAERKKYEIENRSYIRDAIQRKVKKGYK